MEAQKKVRAVTTYETCYATAGDDMTSMLRFQVGVHLGGNGCVISHSHQSIGATHAYT